MKWRIKNPAPQDSRLEKWGDFHFGRSLTKYLTRLGQEVATDYDGDWDTYEGEDVELVLRGKYRHKVKKGLINVMWNISHPADVPMVEYNDYDLVCVASEAYASQLAGQLTAKVIPLLQCTDLEEFNNEFALSAHEREGFIFVGNTRSVERPGVLWSIEKGVPLKIWGRGWSEFIPNGYVVENYVDNQQLGKLYGKSRVVLNDHWSDMKKLGFINNRLFDAIACGLPVISDSHDELQKLFPTELLYYHDKHTLKKCLEEVLLNYPRVVQNINSARHRLMDNFSFQSRAEVLVEEITKLRG